MVLTHALAYTRHRQHELVACIDPDAKARLAFMEKWKVRYGYSTVDEALKTEQFDVASVCGPTGTHLPTLAKLLDADLKAIFVEKPLDGDAIGAKAIGMNFEQKGIPVAVNFTRRFDPAMHTFQSEIAAGRYGELRSIVGWCGTDLMNSGSHMVDLAIFLIGRVPRVVSVNRMGKNISALLDLGGAPFHLLAANNPACSRFEVELAFSQAVVTIEDNGLALRRRAIVPSPDFIGAAVPERGEWIATQYGSAMLVALDELTAWRPGARLSSDIESACISIALTEAIGRQTQEHSA